MAELNKIRFVLFVSLVIFPAHALDVILSGAHEDFKQKSAINIGINDGEKIYRGTLNQLTYEARKGTSKVIVYIISRSRCVEILRSAASETRSEIARELREMHCELVFLGIENIDDDEYHLIGEFISDKIQRNPYRRKNLHIETIGEKRFDQFYRCRAKNFQKCQQITETLIARLRSFPRGAHRPVESNGKEIKLTGFQPTKREVRWPVSVENNMYVPNVSASVRKYDLLIKYPKKKICLLIISGKEYTTITSWGNRGLQRKAMTSLLDAMDKENEVLVILGVFNFDWTEIDIVTQIILEHSKALKSPVYNVFTCGYGMFNTYYLNEYEGDERSIQQQPNSHVSEVMKMLMGREVKKRVIHAYYYYDYKWKSWERKINLKNGRYAPEERFINFTLSSELPNQKIAFIVFDRKEMNDPTDFFVVIQSIEELKLSGISVVLIQAAHFGMDDAHIIAEWIDHHSGVANSEHIAVLGGGTFDTIFQSVSTTYNTFLNTKKNLLETIRNTCVERGNGKSVSVADLDDKNFEVWSYPMNAVVNGFYELDLIPDKNMFNTSNEKRIYFIVTDAYHFKQISAIKSLRLETSSFRDNIKHIFPDWKWSIIVVGLGNFLGSDSHLFAELVKRQTNYGRSFEKFIRVSNFGISEAVYQYKDTVPFDIEWPESTIHASIAQLFEWTREFSNGTHSR